LPSEGACSISCGFGFSGVLTSSRKNCILWGSNAWGKQGNRYTFQERKHNRPTKVWGEILLEKKVDMLCMGDSYAMALTTSRNGKKKVWIWGKQYDDNVRDYPIACPVPYFEERNIKVKKIACGSYERAVITKKGVLYLWGYGLVMKGSGITAVTVPTKIKFRKRLKGVKIVCLDISNSDEHSLALCEIQSQNERQRACFYWGSRERGVICDAESMFERVNVKRLRPREITFFSGSEFGDCSLKKIGVGIETMYCFVENIFFYLNDLSLQDDKLGLLKDLQNLFSSPAFDVSNPFFHIRMRDEDINTIQIHQTTQENITTYNAPRKCTE